MFDEWWNEHPKLNQWWENTKQNTSNVCPAWFAGEVGFSLGTSLIEQFKEVNSTLGYKTDLSLIRGAAYKAEKIQALRAIGNAWCISGFAASSLDSWYQVNHNQEHLGLAFWDVSSDWYVTKSQGVEHLLNGVNEWWKHSNHWSQSE
jgi:hypothetical protein